MARLACFGPLSTPRLAAVALTLEHAPAVFAYASDPDISRLMAWPRHEDMDATRRVLARALVGYAEGGHYEWGLIRKTDGRFLGTCGFGGVDAGRGIADIAYVLDRPYWGLGYGTEAAAAIVQFGFVQLGLRSIEAHAFPENMPSQRVMAKLGLRYRETRMVTDEETAAERPVCVWQLAREQWAEGAQSHPSSGHQ